MADPPAALPPEAAASFSEFAPAPQTARATIRILIVDDDDTLRESCASVLTHEGYDVTVNGKGRAAQELLAHRPFDIVMIDWYMSDVPGRDLLGVALASNPAARAIVVTGKPTVDSSLDALRAGAWDYLPKPFSATQLQILVGRAAHATLIAREQHTKHEQMQQAGGNSEKVRVLGISPSFRNAIALAPRGRDRCVGVPHGRERRRQRAVRPVHSLSQPARHAPVPGTQLCRAPGSPARIRDVRSPPRRVHGRDPRQTRAARDRQRRHAAA